MSRRLVVIRIIVNTICLGLLLLLLLLLLLQELLFLLLHRFELAVPPLLDAVGHLPPSKPQRLVDAHLDELLFDLEVALDEVEVLEQLRIVPTGPSDVLEDDGPSGVVFFPDFILFGFGERPGSFPERRWWRF